MTTLMLDQAPRPSSAIHPQRTTAARRRFRTILAIHRGEVYLWSNDAPEGGWLTRATAPAPVRPARTLRTSALRARIAQNYPDGDAATLDGCMAVQEPFAPAILRSSRKLRQLAAEGDKQPGAARVCVVPGHSRPVARSLWPPRDRPRHHRAR
jgi:hypothetical protein